MSHSKSLYKFVFIFLSLFPLFSFSQSNESAIEKSSAENSYTHKTIALSYISWTELVDFTSASNADRGFANFYGNALSYEVAPYIRHSGMNYQVDLLFGQANVGGSQTVLTYQESYKKFLGAMAQARFAYRLDTKITISAGPLVLFRQVSIPDANGVTPTVGATPNFGAIGVVGARLGKNWELRQSFGTLAFKASTIWSLGLGYKY